jgi:hypothetical protein
MELTNGNLEVHLDCKDHIDVAGEIKRLEK